MSDATTATAQGRTVTGTVVSNKMNKSIVVEIERRVKHPVYEKIVKRTSKMYAHDENNQCQLGDLVVIQECRPLSKTKRWRLVEIVQCKGSEGAA